MKEFKMDLESINSIVNLMSEHGLSEFELEEEGRRISIKRGSTVSVQTVQPVLQQPEHAVPAQPVAAPPAGETQPASDIIEITAPFVGTFYKSSSPDADPFVSIGQEVGPETVICILEAMKVMNEIKAETRGIVKEVLVNNAEPVQYGQPLFRIQKL